MLNTKNIRLALSAMICISYTPTGDTPPGLKISGIQPHIDPVDAKRRLIQHVFDSDSENGLTPRSSILSVREILSPEPASTGNRTPTPAIQIQYNSYNDILTTFSVKKVVGSITMYNARPMINIDVQKIVDQFLTQRGIQDMAHVHDLTQYDLSIITSIKRAVVSLRRDITQKSNGNSMYHGGVIYIELTKDMELRSAVLDSEYLSRATKHSDFLPETKSCLYTNTTVLSARTDSSIV